MAKQCVNCFKKREDGAEFSSNASHFCNSLPCQHARLEALGLTNEKRYKTTSQVENVKRRQEELKAAPQRNKKRGRPKKNTSGRTCNKCGGDPSPNYFY
jgi:hypothetical protein